MSVHPQTHSRKGLAIMLAVITILQLILAAHHPSLGANHAPKEILEAIAQSAQLDRFIHGGLILMYGASLIGFHAFDALLSDRPIYQRCAFPLYVAGFVSLVVAALLDGFVTADFATAFAHGSDSTIASAMVVLTALGISIQIFTQLGLLLFAAAILLWGLALLRQQSRLYLPAVLALLAALAPIALMIVVGTITAKGVLLFVLLQSVWTLAVAQMLWDGRLALGRCPD